MILQSLVNYYDILEKADKISKPGFCMAKVSYALNLSKDGELVGIIPLKISEKRGKKTYEVPQMMEVPEQYKKTVGIKSNFLCETSKYILGIDSSKKPERARQCFNAFYNLHKTILSDVNCVEAHAILSFLDAWTPELYEDNQVLQEYIEDILSGVNLVFHIEGVGFAHENDVIKSAWKNYVSNTSDSVKMQCLVTGEILPIARLHQSIKGVKGAQPTGASIVSFNDRAYESYGRIEQQGLNAPVSERAAFAYTTALNHLLAGSRHKQIVGDTTVVYWADSPKSIYQDIFTFALNPEDKETQEETERRDDLATTKLVGDVFHKLAAGMPVADISNVLNPETRFYVLGLAPNAARLSIRFFLQDSFGKFIGRIMEHYENMRIEKAPFEPEYVPLWKLMQETVSPKSTDKASSPLLSGAVLRAILSGSQYPAALYNSIMIRIRAEREVSRGKAAAIKAYHLKNPNNSNFKEVLTVSLNEQSNNRPYVLGRLFAILEKAQLDANSNIKATIKDRYFTSACATPASVFPVLLRLSNHHIAKSDYGHISERRIQELMDKLDLDSNPFPAHLSLDEQGIFILGYYHQKKANYTKLTKEEE